MVTILEIQPVGRSFVLQVGFQVKSNKFSKVLSWKFLFAPDKDLPIWISLFLSINLQANTPHRKRVDYGFIEFDILT